LAVVALVSTMSVSARSQHLSDEEAINVARTRASIALAEEPGSLGDATANWNQYGVREGEWYVHFGSGVMVAMDDSMQPRRWLVRGRAPNLFNEGYTSAFRPAYRTVAEALGFARDIAERVGLINGEPSEYSPPVIPEPDSQGNVNSRLVSIILFQKAHGYPSMMGGNRVELMCDAKDLQIHSMSVVTGYTYEAPPDLPIPAEAARQAVGSIPDFGELELTKGPAYYEVLRTGVVTTEGARYASSRTMPLVYVFRGSGCSAAVHAVTGKLLTYSPRAGHEATHRHSGAGAVQPDETETPRSGGSNAPMAPNTLLVLVSGAGVGAAVVGAVWLVRGRKASRKSLS
jgi:hypothetical protein